MNGYLSDSPSGLLDEIRRWERRMDELFTFDPFAASPWTAGVRSAARGAYPPLNVGCNADSVDVYLFAAGLDPQKIELSLQQNLLTVSGERQPDISDDARVYRRERFAGSFQRAITLPEDVDPENVEARYRDGVLHVRVRRRESVKPRQIEIQ